MLSRKGEVETKATQIEPRKSIPNELPQISASVIVNTGRAFFLN